MLAWHVGRAADAQVHEKLQAFLTAREQDEGWSQLKSGQLDDQSFFQLATQLVQSASDRPSVPPAPSTNNLDGLDDNIAGDHSGLAGDALKLRRQPAFEVDFGKPAPPDTEVYKLDFDMWVVYYTIDDWLGKVTSGCLSLPRLFGLACLAAVACLPFLLREHEGAELTAKPSVAASDAQAATTSQLDSTGRDAAGGNSTDLSSAQADALADTSSGEQEEPSTDAGDSPTWDSTSSSARPLTTSHRLLDLVVSPTESDNLESPAAANANDAPTGLDASVGPSEAGNAILEPDSDVNQSLPANGETSVSSREDAASEEELDEFKSSGTPAVSNHRDLSSNADGQPTVDPQPASGPVDLAEVVRLLEANQPSAAVRLLDQSAAPTSFEQQRHASLLRLEALLRMEDQPSRQRAWQLLREASPSLTHEMMFVRWLLKSTVAERQALLADPKNQEAGSQLLPAAMRWTNWRHWATDPKRGQAYLAETADKRMPGLFDRLFISNVLFAQGQKQDAIQKLEVVRDRLKSMDPSDRSQLSLWLFANSRAEITQWLDTTLKRVSR